MLIALLKCVPLVDNIHRLAAATDHNSWECYHIWRPTRQMPLPTNDSSKECYVCKFFCLCRETGSV